MKTLCRQKYAVKIFSKSNGRKLSEFRGANLILDQGLTALANGIGMASSFQNCVVGDGTAPNAIPGGSATFTQIGTAITCTDGAFFNPTMNGALLKYQSGPSGQEVYLSGIIGTQGTATASVSFGIAGAAGVVYLVNQTTLANQLYEFDQYNATGNSTAQAVADGVLTITLNREFVFAPKSSLYTINEIGWGSSSGSPAAIYGRALLGAPQIVDTDNYCIVTIQLAFSITPTAPTVNTNANQLFNQYKGTATIAPKFMLETWSTSIVKSNGVSDQYLGGSLDTSPGFFSLITDPTFTQHTVTSAVANDPATIYSIGFPNWAQVIGQLPGVSQTTGTASFTTAGETLYGVCLGNPGTAAAVFSMAVNYSAGTPDPLPSGLIYVSATWGNAWTRQLVNP